MALGNLAHPCTLKKTAGLLKKGGFAIKKLPPEIRMQIYTFFLQLDRPVMLKSDKNEIANLAVHNHIQNCLHGEHTTLNLPDDNAPKSKYIRTVHFCTNRFTKITTRLCSSPSVLNLLLVDKQINNEAKRIFYQKNEFHFATVEELIAATASMGRNRARAIENVCFRFSSFGTTPLFQRFHRLLPNLRRLDLLIDFDSPLVHINKPHLGLKSARGMNAFRTFVSGLMVFNVVGRDMLEERQDDGTTRRRIVDANHNRAVGPWLREEALSEEGKKLLAGQ